MFRLSPYYHFLQPFWLKFWLARALPHRAFDRKRIAWRHVETIHGTRCARHRF